MLSEPKHIDALILQQLIDGDMTVEYARELVLQEKAFAAHRDEYRRLYPGEFLAMVADQIVHHKSYTGIMTALSSNFAGHPFFLEFPDEALLPPSNLTF